MTQTSAIESRGLSKRFGRRTALDGIDTVIGTGERVALIGQNGAGKTTLIRCLLGQHRYAGTLAVFGIEPRKERVRVLEGIGYVPQTPPPLLTTVGELLDFSLGLNARQSLAAISAMATTLGIDLADLASHTFSKLSGGMKQKVLISLALTKAPDLLTLDEPAANLDPEGRSALFGYLRTMAPETTMLIISHRVDEVASLISRVIEMDRGLIVEDYLQVDLRLPRAVEQ